MLMHDLNTLLVTSIAPLLLIVTTEALKASGKITVAATRKFLHTATGLAFMCTWPLYSSDPSARFLAAVLPGLITLRFLLAGLGITHEPRLVAGTARTGNQRELLAGPTMYGVSHVLLTVLAWRNHPAGPAGIAALCAGDGLADVVGRYLGSQGPLAGSLPHNRHKTWMGSIGCFVAATVATATYLSWFNQLHYFNVVYSMQQIAVSSALSSLAATICESLQLPDNLTVPAAAALTTAYWL